MSSFIEQTPTTGDGDIALSILDKTKSGYAPNKRNWERLKETLKDPKYEALDVSVVSMAGPTRIGKSTVLNFAKRALSHWEQRGQIDRSWLDSEEQLFGFATGDTDYAVTTGILIWSRPFVLTDQRGEKYAVILMDTQGSFDTISTTKDNASVYAFSTLLASTQIYNVQHAIDEACLGYLNTFTAFGQHAFPADVKPYQHLTVLVRNWTLNAHQPAGFDGGVAHLNRKLEVTSEMDEESRVKRTNLRDSFQSISCFLMHGPGDVALTENDMSQISAVFKNDLHELIAGSIDRLKSVNGTRLKCRDLVGYMNTLLVVFDTTAMPALRDVFVAFKDSANEGAFKNAVDTYRSKLLGEAKTVGFDVAHKKLAELARQQMIGRLMYAGSEGERFAEKLVEAVENVLTTLKLEVAVQNVDVVKERIQRFSAAIHEIAKTEHVDKAFDRCKNEPLHGLGDLIQGGPELVEKVEQEIKAKMEEERQKIQARQLLESEQKLDNIVANYEKEFEALASKDGVDIADQELRADALNELRSLPGTDQILETKLSLALNRIKEKVKSRFGEHNHIVVDNIFNDFKTAIHEIAKTEHIDKAFDRCKAEPLHRLGDLIQGGPELVKKAEQEIKARMEEERQKIQAKQLLESEQKLQKVVANYEQKLKLAAIKDSIVDADNKLRQDALKELRTSPGTDQSLEGRLTASLNGIKEKIELEIRSQNQAVIDDYYAKFKRDFQSAMDGVKSNSYIDEKFEQCKREAFADLEKNIKGGEVNEAKRALTDRTSDLKWDTKMAHNVGGLARNFGALLRQHAPTDVTFVIGGDRIPAHREILAAQSDRLRAMFAADLAGRRNNDVILENTSLTAFLPILNHAYTKELDIKAMDEQTLLGVLELSHRYQFRWVQNAVATHLAETVTIGTVCERLNAAELLKMESLKKACMVPTLATELLRRQELVDQLTSSALASVLALDDLEVPEIDLFQAVCGWIEKHRGDDARPLLSNIRLSLLTVDDLYNAVRPTNHYSERDIIEAMYERGSAHELQLPHHLPVTRIGPRRQTFDSSAEEFVMRVYSVQRNGFMINTIQLTLPSHLDHYSYKVDVSPDDRRTWSTVCGQDHCEGQQTLYINPQRVTDLRIRFSTGTVEECTPLTVVASYSDSVVADFNPEQRCRAPKHNVATAATARLLPTSKYKYTPDRLFDGDLNNFAMFPLNDPAKSLIIRFTQPYYISSLVFLFPRLDDWWYSYYIEVSDDKTTWNRVYDKSTEQCSGWQVVRFAPQRVVYVRIVGTRCFLRYYNSFLVSRFECPIDEARLPQLLAS